MLITYIDRRFVDRYTCVDKIKTIRAISTFTQGGLTYVKINRFNHIAIDTDMIISVKKDGAA